MDQLPENQAAWLPTSQANPLVIDPSPYTTPGPGQLLVKNSALGINPVDWLKQLRGDAMLSHVRYPAVLGEDVSGTVVAVGEGVTRFRIGDRVLAIAAAITSNNAAEGGFQLYTIVRGWLATPLPDHINFEQGCVLPLALLTAGLGLFGKDYLGLDLPTVPKKTPTPPPSPTTGTSSDETPSPSSSRVVIIAGGASSVGGTAIQLATSAGYTVISTASPQNHAHVKSLGAAHVFDYKSPDLATDLNAAIRGRQLCGCYALGDGTADVFATVIAKHQEAPGLGPTRKMIARAEGTHNVPSPSDSDGGVEVKFILIDSHVIGPESPVRPIFQDFLPVALAGGEFVPAPEPLVVGTGLERVQEAFAVQRGGVSARKVVVVV